MQVDDILSFPFIDPPPKEALLRSLELLYSLDALDDDGKLNDVGKKNGEVSSRAYGCTMRNCR